MGRDGHLKALPWSALIAATLLAVTACESKQGGDPAPAGSTTTDAASPCDWPSGPPVVVTSPTATDCYAVRASDLKGVLDPLSNPGHRCTFLNGVIQEEVELTADGRTSWKVPVVGFEQAEAVAACFGADGYQRVGIYTS